MLSDVVNRIEARLKAVGLSATAASRQAGLGEDAIRNMKRALQSDDRKGVSTRTISALAPILQTSVAWLMEGIGADGDPQMVRIIGRVGANPDDSIIYTSADDVWHFAPRPPGGSEKSVGLEVVGHSMRWVAEDGALIYFEDQHAPPTPDQLGQIVILETEDGQVLVKRLLRGSEPGRYDLESQNGATMDDRRLKWAADITAIIPPKQARKIVKRGEAA